MVGIAVGSDNENHKRLKTISVTSECLSWNIVGRKTFVTDKVNRDEAKKAAIIYLNQILSFVRPLSDHHPHTEFPRIHLLLEEMLVRIEQSKPPLRTKQEVFSYLVPTAEAIINFSPRLANQLMQFWQTQKQISEKAGKDKTLYPTEYLDENKLVIENIEAASEKVLARFKQNPSDEITIYALLFIHILKTETLEDRLIHQLDVLLKRYELRSKFNPVEIYSVDGAIPRKKKDGEPAALTQAEAIRNCLAHNLFQIDFAPESWKIVFDNRGTYDMGKYSYNYKREFNKNEFVQYFALTEILYKSTMVLVYIRILAQIVLWRILESS